MKKNKLIIATMLLSSCMMGPDYKQPQKISNTDVAHALNLVPNKASLNKDLLDFNDPILKKLIEQAIINNPTYQSAIISSRQARANVKIAESNLLPSLDLSAQYDYLKNNENTQYLVTEDYYQVGLDATWELDIFGGNQRALEAQDAKYKATLYQVQSAYVSLVSEVASNYVDYKISQELIKATKENINFQTQLTQFVSQKANAGLVNSVDLNQSLYLLNATQATLSALEYQQEMYKNSLALLTGQLPNALDKVLDENNSNLVNKNIDYDISSIYNLPANVVRNRPDVKAQEQLLIAENALIGTYIANMYPNISLSASFGFEALNPGSLFNSSSQVYGYNPKLALPIFNFGALKNKIELQKDATLIAANDYENSILTASAEIKNAMVAINTENTKNKRLKSSYNFAKQATSLNQERYNSGLIEYSVVLESQQDKIAAQNEMIKSNGALYKNIITFYKSIGGNQ